MKDLLDIEEFEEMRRYTPDLAKEIVVLCIANVRSSLSHLSTSEGVEITKKLSEEEVFEMVLFYEGLIKILSEMELYEACNDTMLLIHKLQPTEDQVDID